MKKLNCAVIGCGRIGCGFDDNSKKIRTHAGSYFHNTKTELIALCDIDKKKLKKYGKKYSILKLYTSSEELFKNEKLDCVSICTLVESHLQHVQIAAKNGVKVIFLEKPIARNLREAKEIIKICKSNNIILFVDHQRRFVPIYHDIKKIIENNTLGEIQLVDMIYGGGIANTGSHMFDLLRMFFGEVKIINAKVSDNISNNRKDPNLDISLRFKNNINCEIHAIKYNNFAIFKMNIIFNRGLIEIDLIKNRYKQFQISKINNSYNILKNKKIKSSVNSKTPIQLGLEEIIKIINSNKLKKFYSYEDGLKALELIIASIISADRKKLIKIPLKKLDVTVFSK